MSLKRVTLQDLDSRPLMEVTNLELADHLEAWLHELEADLGKPVFDLEAAGGDLAALEGLIIEMRRRFKGRRRGPRGKGPIFGRGPGWEAF